MADKIISILGCGWLGLPLAKHLVKRNYSVNGSTTTAEKCESLKASKITPYLLTAAPNLTGENIDDFFQSRVLFLNIPFRRALEDPNYYKQQIDSIIPHIEASSIDFVIFASSTSVYPASSKQTLEDEPMTPDNPRSKTLRLIEQALMDNTNFKTTIVRFAGMYGQTRKISQILAGRTGLAHGMSPVNLIHLDDCVAIVMELIERDIRNEILNACSDGHPTRKDIYTKAARHYGLVPPQFTDEPSSRLKIVNNEKIKEKLKYTFLHPDPLQF